MIFYFSGTGNSLYVAKKLSEKLNQPLVSIADAMKRENFVYELKTAEPIIWVFPIYSWALPKMVTEFIKKVVFNDYHSNYVTAVITCGANIGNAMTQLEQIIGKIRFSNGNLGTLNSGFTVVMPSNYMIMGDVEPPEVQREMLLRVDQRLEVVSTKIENRVSNTFDVEKGRFPHLRTDVIGKFFNKYALDASPFWVQETCIGCEICYKVCNSGTIVMNEGKPFWNKGCVQCLACINYCPVKAIQYGKKTSQKGRYHHPDIKVEEMFRV